MKIYDFNYRYKKRRRGLKIGLFLTVFLLSFMVLKSLKGVDAYGEDSGANSGQSQIAGDGFLERIKIYIVDGFNNIFDRDKDVFDSDTNGESISSQDLFEEKNGENEKYIILVNQYNPIDSDYVPDSMTDIARTVSATKNEILLEDRAAEAYIEMVYAMEEDINEKLVAISGYRSYSYQTNLHNAAVEKKRSYLSYEAAVKAASREVARPGTSEHQLGLAIDVTSKEIGLSLSSKFQYTKAYEWLKAHAHEYGFVVRYQPDKTEITGIIFEPWHLRYLGMDLSLELFETGLSLEEYYESIK